MKSVIFTSLLSLSLLASTAFAQPMTCEQKVVAAATVRAQQLAESSANFTGMIKFNASTYRVTFNDFGREITVAIAVDDACKITGLTSDLASPAN